MKWDALNGIKLTREQMEQRRQMAAEDLLTCMKQADVARKYGVNRSNVSRWAKTLREEGNEGLRLRKAKGCKSKLTSNQKKVLVDNDIELTKRMVEAGKLMDIEVLDHIIIGDGEYISLKERELI